MFKGYIINNKYCYKKKILGDNKYVKAGCSTAAMAAIVAYNKFPPYLYYNGDSIPYSIISKCKNPELKQKYVTDVMREGISLLYGSIFHSVKPIFRWKKGTCITPEQIKNCFELFGYSNVRKHSDDKYSHSLKKATSDMLENNKPVFISAMEEHDLIHGHSWVIDGAMYDTNDEDNWMVHCNWGWNGSCNGYYASNCLLPDDGSYIEYMSFMPICTINSPGR